MEKQKTHPLLKDAQRQICNQLIDFYLIDELLQQKPRGFAERVARQVYGEIGVKPNPRTVRYRASHIMRGSALRPISRFTGRFSPRGGKDHVYAGLWSLVDVHLPLRTRFYVGLAAYQMDEVRTRTYQAVVLERDKEHYEALRRLIPLVNDPKRDKRVFPREKVTLKYGEIFTFMQSGEARGQFNIIDLDLMQHLPESDKERQMWANAIANASKVGKVVLHLNLVIGRSSTEEQEMEKLHDFCGKLAKVDTISIVGGSLFKYTDAATPMRSQQILLEKRSK